MDGSLLSKLGLKSCDLITISSEKGSMIDLKRSVIADKILKISRREAHLTLCQDAGAPCQQLTFQSPKIHEKIQGLNHIKNSIKHFKSFLLRNFHLSGQFIGSACTEQQEMDEDNL